MQTQGNIQVFCAAFGAYWKIAFAYEMQWSLWKIACFATKIFLVLDVSQIIDSI